MNCFWLLTHPSTHPRTMVTSHVMCSCVSSTPTSKCIGVLENVRKSHLRPEVCFGTGVPVNDGCGHKSQLFTARNGDVLPSLRQLTDAPHPTPPQHNVSACTPSECALMTPRTLDFSCFATLSPEPVTISSYDTHLMWQELGPVAMQDTTSDGGHSDWSCSTECSYDGHQDELSIN